MKRNIKLSYWLLLFTFCSSFFFSSCNSCERRSSTLSNPKVAPIAEHKIKKVTFFLENSGSMLGYVNESSGITEFVEVVSELAEKPDFVSDKAIRDFNLINGKVLNITTLGSDPVVLKKQLNIKGYNCGSVQNSNLNAMFQKAMSIAGGANVSILISDGIYDIGNKDSPFASLALEGKETRSRFIERLKNSNIETILIKLNSKFQGDYCYASKPGSIAINHSRPYYIWIFGEAQLLNRYFSDQYIVNNLKGYEDLARFIKIENSNVPHEVIPDGKLGEFRYDHSDKNKLNGAQLDRHGKGFQLPIAVDLSQIPFSDSYLSNISNFTANNDYSIIDIKKSTNKLFLSFNPTHIVTVRANKSPYGTLVVNLKNELPTWINQTNIEDESNILIDTKHTFGFKYLTQAIHEAYQEASKNANVVSIEVKILK